MTKPEDILSAARLCLQNGHLDAAAVLCRHVIEQKPLDLAAHQLLGVVAFQKGDFLAARQHFSQAVELSPLDASLHYNLGTALHQLNEFEVAIEHFRRAIALRENYGEAHNNLGHALMKLGRLDDAAAHFQQAIAIDARHAEAHNNLGLLLAARGMWHEAVTKYREALVLKPQLGDAYRNLAVALAQLNDHAGAAACLERATEAFPTCGTTRLNYATVLIQMQRWEDALQQCDAAVQIVPTEFMSYYLRGNVLRQLGNSRRAINEYRRAVELRPDSPEALNNLAVTLVEEGQHIEAEQHCRQAIAIRDTYPEAWSNLGECLRRQGRWVEAQTCLRRALELRPQYIDAENNLAAALIGNAQLDEAVEVLRRLLARVPDHALAHCNWGLAHAIAGDWKAAEIGYREALQHNSELPEAHLDLGLLMLSHGDLERGWDEYAWRWKSPERPKLSSLAGPMWNGEPLDAGTVLLRTEQGLGDTIQFVRYAPYVKRLVKTVLVECAPRMVPLLSTCSGIDGFVTSGQPHVPWDAQVPLLDLPRIFQTTLTTIPAAVPYLHASAERVQKWRSVFETDHHFRIGIAWQGNPAFRWDRWRSIPLAAFAPLARIGGVKLYSLQTNQGLDQIANVDFDVINLAPQLDEAESAFADTAAVMQHLDLMISSDTSIAHLAGALAAPTWVAISWYPDWRWMLSRDDSPWYPTMRLFRQERNRPWIELFELMATELRQLIECGRSPLEKAAS